MDSIDEWWWKAMANVATGREGGSDYTEGFVDGAAALATFLGMAEAIMRNRPPMIVERRYWTSVLDGKRYYECFCPGCGTGMKGREAGVDEGTDGEWCGLCRP